MSRVDNEILHRQMNWRYACKRFDSNKVIREEDWNILAETLRLSASSYGLQPWKFVVVKSPELRQKLRDLSWGQTAVTDASHFIVLTYLEKIDEAYIEKFMDRTAKVRGVDISALTKFRDNILRDLLLGRHAPTLGAWAQRQTYIAMGSFLTTAALMEIDTLPMEGLDPEGYDRALGLEGSGYKTVGAIACGYRSEEDKTQHAKKVRFELNDVLSYK